jgi:hypothetical protein
MGGFNAQTNQRTVTVELVLLSLPNRCKPSCVARHVATLPTDYRSIFASEQTRREAI